MRVKLFGLLLGCGLAAAVAAPSLACDYHVTTASNDKAPQQTAEAQQTTPTQQSTQSNAN